MKIGTTILSFPDQQKQDPNDLLLFDTIETTRKHLYDKRSTIATSMLSVIDMTTIDKSITINDNIDSTVNLLVEAIFVAMNVGLTSLSFGCPALRKCSYSFKQAIKYFDNVATIVERFNDDKLFTVYIEPLYSDTGFLNSYVDIVNLCRRLNYNNNYGLLQFKPLFDTGWWITHQHTPEVNQENFYRFVAQTTDRIHFSHSDTKSEFDLLKNQETKKIFNFVKDVLRNNPNIEVIYEHINTNDNESYLDFLNEMKILKERIENVKSR